MENRRHHQQGFSFRQNTLDQARRDEVRSSNQHLFEITKQVRARARSEATSFARSGNRRTNYSFGVRARRLQSKRYNRNHALGWKRTASSGVDGVRRTAWDDDEGGGSVIDYIRRTIGARYQLQHLAGLCTQWMCSHCFLALGLVSRVLCLGQDMRLSLSALFSVPCVSIEDSAPCLTMVSG